MLHTVVTTIHEPSVSLVELAARSVPGARELVIVADRKTPAGQYHTLIDRHPAVRFLTIDSQRGLDRAFADVIPYDHYARKNLGYVHALRSDARLVFDTDDDTMPLAAGWDPPAPGADGMRVTRRHNNGSHVFFNTYTLFHRGAIWPRGFPLDRLHASPAVDLHTDPASRLRAGVWQGLVDGDPDVDAIFRLTRPEAERRVTFEAGPGAAILDEFVYCPFNTQNTWWTEPEVFFLLYLPSTVSSRVCDIVRGYVAQRVLWSRGFRLAFTAASARQERNAHHLLGDLADEVPLYLRAGDIPGILDTAAAGFDRTPHDLVRCYTALAATGVVGPDEPRRAGLWLEAIAAAR